MRLTESVSKDLLARYGLKSPPGRLCTTAEEAGTAAGELGGPVYVKAQIPFGDRASLGLVVRADDSESASGQARALLGRTVEGMTVTSVLVESGVESSLSAYISAHVDDEAGARVLRIGVGGGAGYDPTDAQIQVPLPVGGLETYEVRRLVARRD